MTANDPALAQLAESLGSLARSGEPAQLREYLSGRRLPAIGGELDPAEVILRAISRTPADVRKGLAKLLALLVSEETGSGTPSVLLSALYLAADLPADAELFASLKKLRGHLPAEWEDIGIHLWEALVYQQTDQSLEPEWFSILRPSETAAWTSLRRTLLLIAWRGLLWIPPRREEWGAGELINFPRLGHGLGEIYREVSNYEEDGLALLQTCLDILGETYPRSGEFWAESFLPYLGNWPEELSEIVHRWLPSSFEPSEAAYLQSAFVDPLSEVKASLALMKRISRDFEENLSKSFRPESHFAQLHRDLESVSRLWDEILKQQSSLLVTERLTATEEIEEFRQQQRRIESLIEDVRKTG
jgi:hypothetical protein